MNSFFSLLDISITDAKELGQEFAHEFTSNFSDGKLDGENNFEPITYQWFNSDYRQGYLLGMAQRIGVESALIYEVEMNKVIFIAEGGGAFKVRPQVADAAPCQRSAKVLKDGGVTLT